MCTTTFSPQSNKYFLLSTTTYYPWDFFKLTTAFYKPLKTSLFTEFFKWSFYYHYILPLHARMRFLFFLFSINWEVYWWATLPPQQLLCESDAWNVDTELKSVIICSHPLASIPVGFFHSIIYCQILQVNCLLVLPEINWNLLYMKKNVSHLLKLENQLTSECTQKGKLK